MNKEKQIEELTRDMCDSCREAVTAEECQLNCCDGVRRHAEALYARGYRKQEWISVDERLPEIEGVYLAYTTRRTIEIAHFYPYYVNGKPQFDYWITHWMPLPEAPKGGAE